MAGMNILLVEDDLIEVMAIQRALRKAGVDLPVVVASDGRHALSLMRGESGEPLQKPYVVLLDLNMPRMGGLEFLEVVRSSEDLQETVVFVLTTSSGDGDRAAAYRKNVAGYMVKGTVAKDWTSFVRLLEAYSRLVELPK